MMEAAKRVWDRAKDRRPLPVSFDLVALADANIDSVATLHSSAFDVETTEVYRRLKQCSRSINYDPQLSSVLLVENEVRAFLICAATSNPARTFIYGLFVSPQLRLGWATPFVKYGGLDRLLDQGIREVEFEALNSNQDTVRFSTKSGAYELPSNLSE